MVAKKTDGFRCQAKGKTLDLYIYDVIGWYGVTPSDVATALDNAKNVTTINVYVNSPGGSIFDGFAIYNLLMRHKARVVMHIDGLAASAASFVVMAGDEIRMAANAYMMIHNPVAVVWGEATDMRKVADLLDKLRGTIVSTYAARSGQSEEQLTEWMDDETWFTAEDAEEAGLVDTVIAAKEGEEATNDFDLSVFNNTPPALMPAGKKPKQPQRASSRQAVETIVAGFPDVFGSLTSDVAGESGGDVSLPDQKENQMAGKETTTFTEAEVKVKLIEALNKWDAEAKPAQAKATIEAVNTAVAEAQVTAKAEHEKATAEAVNKATEAADKVVRKGIKEVLARCETAGISLTDARGMIDKDLSLEDAKDAVIEALVKDRKAVGGGTGSGEQGNPEAKAKAKYIAEFKAAGGQQEIDCTEEEYVESRIRTDAGGTFE